jgi:glycosyltransferase involved in cell wall biosynthesis
MREQTVCISVHNGIKYLPLAVKSVRENSYHKDCPFVIYSENSDDGTNEWLEDNKNKYDLDVYIETENKVRRGIGGGMNFCADKVKTEFINFLQADIYVSRNWDEHLFECYFEMVGNDRGIVFSNRIQPDIFNDNERPGTVFVPLDLFGAYHHDFNEEYFYYFASRTSRFPDDDFTKRPKHLEEFEINSMTEFQLKYGKLPDIDEFQFVRPMPIIDGSPNRIDRSKE